jgi:alkylated DNA repair protein (DNA oxidative demethylase)
MKVVHSVARGDTGSAGRKPVAPKKTADLFGDTAPPIRHELAEGAVVLHGKARPWDTAIQSALADIIVRSPFRHMMTPGGFMMSVAMTNCGQAGWITDRTGYRYDRLDPATDCPWPEMPDCFLDLAVDAAADAGYPDFRPDACLINRYEPGARLTLHQDKNESDFRHPIVSVSLGLPATFLFGGLKRNDPTLKVGLRHGDVVVWGGPSRLRYHGVNELKDGEHELLGCMRINLTFRRAL